MCNCKCTYNMCLKASGKLERSLASTVAWCYVKLEIIVSMLTLRQHIRNSEPNKRHEETLCNNSTLKATLWFELPSPFLPLFSYRIPSLLFSPPSNYVKWKLAYLYAGTTIFSLFGVYILAVKLSSQRKTYYFSEICYFSSFSSVSSESIANVLLGKYFQFNIANNSQFLGGAGDHIQASASPGGV